MVNQAFVKKLFKPGEDPIGQHIGANEVKNSGDFEIVGVVEDTKYQSARDRAEPMYFTPMLQQSRSRPPKDVDASLYAGQIVLQMKAMTPGLESQVRKTLARIDPNLSVDHYQTFEKQIEGNFSGERTDRSADAAVWIASIGAGCCGSVWRDCVQRAAADAGDWHTNGLGAAREVLLAWCCAERCCRRRWDWRLAFRWRCSACAM